MSNFINAQANDPAGMAFLNELRKLEQNDQDKKKSWNSFLQTQGVVASHPENGWVDREENYIFNNSDWTIWGELKPNVLVAIGDPDDYRVVRLMKFVKWQLAYNNNGNWYFEEVSDENQNKFNYQEAVDNRKYLLDPQLFGFSDKRAEEIIESYYTQGVNSDSPYTVEADMVDFTINNICKTPGEKDWFDKAFKLQKVVDRLK